MTAVDFSKAQGITYGWAYEVVREFFPSVTNKEANEILWNHTGFPGFFTGRPTRCIRKQLRKLKATLKAGKQPCDFCNEPALERNTLCERCQIGWDKCTKHDEECA